MHRTSEAIRFTLVQKLIAGFAIIMVSTMAALLFSLNGLYSLKKTAHDIAHTDLDVILTVTKLRESLLAQERYAGKFRILPSDEFAILFHTREKDFLDLLQHLRQLRPPHESTQIERHYAAYRQAAGLLFNQKSALSLTPLAGKLLGVLDEKQRQEQARLSARLAEADRQENKTISLALIFAFSGFSIAIVVASLFVYRFSMAIRHLQRATHRIAEGDFDYVPQVRPGDEIGLLAQDFVRMATRLKELEQISLDASPLTRLPGNIAIERTLTQHLESGATFAFCYADLDNFKAYNDRYGYIQASELLKWTAEVIHQTAKSNASPDAFVGHVGGDDFVLVIRPEEVETVCTAIIERFDETIADFYSAEDVTAGGIVGADRYGVLRKFPIMTISIAVVICQRGSYDTALEVAQVAAQIKDNVKGTPGSNYLVNRRKILR
jgi:diguanylate cyclase (GGDEF)-like protein